MYLAFDTETSGLLDDCNLLTAHFIILDDNLTKIDEMQLNIQHEFYKVFPKAIEVNKIDIIKHHNSSIPIKKASELLVDFLKKHKPSHSRFVPVGHNVQFDIKFILSNGLLTQEQYNHYISYFGIDTLCIAQFLKLCKIIPKDQSMSLGNLARYFNKTYQGELHDAKVDTEITVGILESMRDYVIVQNSKNSNASSSNKKRRLE